nr:MAG TPA: hypothetical protein [Caudoviricetes sp.]
MPWGRENADGCEDVADVIIWLRQLHECLIYHRVRRRVACPPDLRCGLCGQQISCCERSFYLQWLVL